MNAYNSQARASPKTQLIRSMEGVIDDINRIGEIKQIRVHHLDENGEKTGETDYYVGLVLNTQPKQKYTYIDLIDGNLKIGRHTVRIPKHIYEDENQTEIHTRKMIERTYSEENQFIPLDKDGMLTTDPEEVTTFRKVSLRDIEKKMQEVR